MLRGLLARQNLTADATSEGLHMAEKESSLIALFDDRGEAEKAVRELEQAGFSADQIGMVIRGSDVAAGGMITDAVGAKDARGAIAGSTAGAVAGGILGAATAIALPGVGPLLAAGIFTAAFGGAIAGTAVGGILGAMTGLNVSQKEAEYYDRAFASGKAIVAVKPGNRAADAERILHARGGYDMHVRADEPVPTKGYLSEP
jgi:hypothetical protein